MGGLKVRRAGRSIPKAEQRSLNCRQGNRGCPRVPAASRWGLEKHHRPLAAQLLLSLSPPLLIRCSPFQIPPSWHMSLLNTLPPWIYYPSSAACSRYNTLSSITKHILIIHSFTAFFFFFKQISHVKLECHKEATAISMWIYLPRFCQKYVL